MRRFPLTGEDAKPDSPINKILQEGLGPISVLSVAPTTTGGELPNHGDMGTFGGNLYINQNGTVYMYAGVLT